MKDFFNIHVVVKTGVETFDDNFRNHVLNKNATFQSIEELKQYFDSPCLMVGIKGQTKMCIRDSHNTLFLLKRPISFHNH